MAKSDDDILAELAAFEEDTLQRFKPISAGELKILNLLPPEPLLSPVWSHGDIIMISADRGVGKTHFALGNAIALATGTVFLRYHAPVRKRVLYIDGEMGGALMKARMIAAERRLPPNVAPLSNHLHILSPDTCQDGIMIDLGSDMGRDQAEVLIKYYKPDAIFLDNISTLFRSGGPENDSESWNGPQAWLISLKARGYSVCLVHHLGKNGNQRGTSKREDILATSIKLKRPSDYTSAQGARFTVELTKCRAITGSDAEAYEAHLVDDQWVTTSPSGQTLDSILELKKGGMSLRDIEEATGIPRSTLSRMIARAKTGGGDE